MEKESITGWARKVMPWGYEEMKNSDEKVNIGAVKAKNAVFRVGEGLTHLNMIKN